MHEFNLIQQYFTWDEIPSDISTAVGDDAAVLNIPTGKQLVTSVDTFIEGVHFPKNTSPHSIGHKALVVNLSDIAAMGASPKWFTLALTLPEIDQAWLESFSEGLKSIAQKYNCFLVGGDTTRGPLSISIQVMGLVDTGRALLRSGANVSDKIYVTGSLGDAAIGLQSILSGSAGLCDTGDSRLSKTDSEYCKRRLNKPEPRLKQSEILKSYATSCIDISDGLLQDLSHILTSSNVGAELDLSALPLSSTLENIDREQALQYALTGGDDYELLFTIPANQEARFLEKIDHKVTCIGLVTKRKKLITDETGKTLESAGYNHFYVE